MFPFCNIHYSNTFLQKTTFQRVRSQPDFIEAARPKRKAEGFTESESDDSDDEPEPEAGMASAPGVLQGEAKAEPSPTKGEATSPTKVEKKEEDEAAKRWAKQRFFLVSPPWILIYFDGSKSSFWSFASVYGTVWNSI